MLILPNKDCLSELLHYSEKKNVRFAVFSLQLQYEEVVVFATLVSKA